MEIKEFIEKFVTVFDDTAVDTLLPNTKFREIEEWSSLTALSVIAFADEEFGVELSGVQIRQAETIEDLYNLMDGK